MAARSSLVVEGEAEIDRRFWLYCFLYFTGADALGTDVCARGRVVHHDTDLLQVRIEPAAGGAVGVAAVIAVARFLTANCTNL